uniref:Homeodomain-only protein n=1 Tax=Suricata suricatta TaxID=37032 RepID=A0A673T9X0_SURSU
MKRALDSVRCGTTSRPCWAVNSALTGGCGFSASARKMGFGGGRAGEGGCRLQSDSHKPSGGHFSRCSQFPALGTPGGNDVSVKVLLQSPHFKKRAETMSAETASGPTEDQVEILEYNFNKVNKHPDPTTLCLIAAEAGLSEEETQKWFKQRLAQWRQSEGLPSECRSVTD